jgi:murein L,D-transpeptidase YcbB/YkuD
MPTEKEIVKVPEQMDTKVTELITASLNYAMSNEGKIDDSISLYNDSLSSILYKQKSYVPLWSSTEKWLPQGDSLLHFIEHSSLYGLYPGDYHFDRLKKVRNIFLADSLMKSERKDAALWARADLMLSDALISIFHDINLGRLPKDSITMRKDSVLDGLLIAEKFNAIVSGLSLDSVIATLEPKHKGYKDIKTSVKNFLDSANFNPISAIIYPNKNSNELRAGVIKRLFESGYIDSSFMPADSLQLAAILKKYQKDKKLTEDGKIGGQTIRMLNLSDAEKFNRIAITLDRYKMLPEEMPGTYIWINIPSYTLKLFSNGTIIVSSRVVVGKQKTRTPVLTSAISDMITYPQWNIPQSIIVKEILPALKKNPDYLTRKGYGLFDSKGEEVDPYSVNWSKFSKGIPYRVIQGSGDDNALGILKFNFYNKYAVYIHDTNQRYYFGLDSRALSHGCIRVQEWEKIAFFILNLENEFAKARNRNSVSSEELRHWLANKEKHIIPVSVKIPIFVRYFTCESTGGKIIFFEDIYDEDKELATRLFAGKKPIL